MIESIEKLLNSKLTSYNISKNSGVSTQQIDYYRKNKVDVGNIALRNGLKLYEYYKKVEKTLK
ncbi:MAG: hypothetical protein DI638_01960 [Gemella sp.]|nr:MAG: hypothetical protein DI638_01960 [Gemella sp.]